MQHPVDVGSIVPSTRDLLQPIATRRKTLSLIAQLGEDRSAEEAARLDELSVSAFSFAEPGPALQLAARATKTVPSLCLHPASDQDALLTARYYGADGVCIDDKLPVEAWDKLAKTARTMRMLPLAMAHSAAGVEAAVKAGAKALLLSAPTAAELCALAAAVPRSMILVGSLESAEAASIRGLLGHIDALIVPPSVHAAPGFTELLAELDA
jgi:indole-3-glycerol phosphate synthase